MYQTIEIEIILRIIDRGKDLEGEYWTHFKNCFKYSVCIKLIFVSYILSFFIWFNTLKVMTGKKNVPGDHKSNFKKVGSIPCGFNTMGTLSLSIVGLFWPDLYHSAQ